MERPQHIVREALGVLVHDDFDWFIGSASPDSSEESIAMEWLNGLPRDLGVTDRGAAAGAIVARRARPSTR